MKFTKRLLSLLVASAILAASFSACSSGGSTSDSATSSQDSSSGVSVESKGADKSEDEGGEDPGDADKLSLGLSRSSNVEDYETNYFTGLIEEAANVELEFKYYASSGEDAKTQIAADAAADTLPDTIISTNLSRLEVYNYGSQGYFIDLTDYYKNGKYFNEIESEEDKEAMLRAATAPDGNKYAFIDFMPEPWNLTPRRMWINQVWLDKLGLDMPTTTDELYEVMKAFVTQDPNGNGKNDEIGIYGNKDAWGGQTNYSLMNAFTFFNGFDANNGLNVEDDGETVYAPYVTEEWRAGLEYMNKLYSEGLFNTGMFTEDTTAFTATLSNEEPIVGLTAAGGWGYWDGSLDSPNFRELSMMAPIAGPEGVAYTTYTQYMPIQSMMVTSSCKNVEAALRMGDMFYRPDISLSSRYGIEGEDWTTDPQICKEYNALYADMGRECTLVQLNAFWGDLQNKHWQNTPPVYVSLDSYMGIDAEDDPDNPDAENLNAKWRSYSAEVLYDAHPDIVLPQVAFNDEEADAVSTISTDVKDYVKESMAGFIANGVTDSSWDEYVKQLDQIGLQDFIANTQSAWDRMSEN